MKRRIRHTAIEAARMYRRGHALLADGATIPVVCRKLGVSEATFHRWRRKFAVKSRVGVTTPSTQESNARHKQLERENKRLKLLVAELTLENAFLKDRLEGVNG